MHRFSNYIDNKHKCSLCETYLKTYRKLKVKGSRECIQLKNEHPKKVVKGTKKNIVIRRVPLMVSRTNRRVSHEAFGASNEVPALWVPNKLGDFF